MLWKLQLHENLIAIKMQSNQKHNCTWSDIAPILQLLQKIQFNYRCNCQLFGALCPDNMLMWIVKLSWTTFLTLWQCNEMKLYLRFNSELNTLRLLERKLRLKTLSYLVYPGSIQYYWYHGHFDLQIWLHFYFMMKIEWVMMSAIFNIWEPSNY